MNYYIFSIGVIILSLVSYDLISTALSVRGAGFISKRLSKIIWKTLLKINHNTGSSKVLEFSGAFILVAIVFNWLLFIWLSASLLFISDTNSLVNVETNTPTDIVSKIFYSGYTLSTLGLGDIEPYGQFWEVLTAVLSFTGLILISIAITFLIPVVSAEIEKRKLSVYITTMGCSVEEILLNHYSGRDFKALKDRFLPLTDLIISHAQNHKAYSVLHYFHSSDKKEAFVLNLTNLDEALTIIMYFIPEEMRPEKTVMIGLRKAITNYLMTLPEVFIKPSKDTPPIPLLNDLKESEIPLIDKEVREGYDNLSYRRRLLLALVNDDGWNWDDADAGAYSDNLPH